MSEDVVDQPPPPSSGEDWPARIEQLLGEAESAPSVEERVTVLCRVAEIYERRLSDPNGALVTLQAAAPATVTVASSVSVADCAFSNVPIVHAPVASA